ncbi:MAG: hypothetical protein WD275_01665 [Rhodothermales bacterium]
MSSHELITVDVDLTPPERAFNLDEAVELIHRIQLALESIEDYRLKLKWCIGFVLVHVDRPYGTVSKSFEEIEARLLKEHGIKAGRSNLYECDKLYRLFGGNLGRFEAWIRDEKQRLGRPVYWFDIQNKCLGGRSNPEIIGKVAADERDLLQVELAIEALERLIRRAQEGSDDAQGVLVALLQTMESIPGPGSTRIPRDDQYLEFVRQHPCAVCRRPGEAHHAFGERGAGIKASDFATIPLCRDHHSELHAMGRASFERIYDLDMAEVAFNLLHRFLTGAWVTLRLGD